MSFELGELFTGAVRHVVPLALVKKLTYSFDVHGPQARLSGDAVAMKCGLHRLLCGAIDLVDVGFLVFYAQAQVVQPGKCLVGVRAAGTGLLAGDSRIDQVLERLQMHEDRVPSRGGRARLRRASGRCPSTGTTVHFASLPSEGVLFSAEWLLPLMSVAEHAEPVGHKSRAWLIHDDEVVTEALARRLQRLGWATMKFDSAAPALRRLRAVAQTHARPALVIAIESTAVTPASIQVLRPCLADWTERIYAVTAGSPSLMNPHAVPGFDVRMHPFSPDDLRALTGRISPARDEASGTTVPAPLTMEHRPLLLIVDDNDVNRVVATGLAQSLGCEVAVARGSGEAIEECRHAAPVVVLVDMQLPRCPGLDTVRRLREMQRAGVVAPCPIIATLDGGAAGLLRACEAAGVDGHLVKPLQQPAMHAELRRVCGGALLHTQRIELFGGDALHPG